VLEKGAFTGALLQRKGRFELADGGSLFLDEIGDISLERQPKTIARYPGAGVRAFVKRKDNPGQRANDCRDASGSYGYDSRARAPRGSVLPVQRFPDRDPTFAGTPRRHSSARESIRGKVCAAIGQDIRFISRDAMEALANAPWKGNARELGNLMERCVILTRGNELNVPHLERKDFSGRKVVPVASSFPEAGRRVILDALSDASGPICGKGGAVERLGLKRTTLQNKSINRSDYSADHYTNRMAGPQATS